MKKYFAELIGTMILVLFGVGSAVLAGSYIGNVGVGLCFGVAVIAMAYCFGGISGAHLNPAVSTGMWTSGRIGTKQFAGYVIAQFIGAAIGAVLVYLIASGQPLFDIAVNGLGQNGFGEGYASGYSMTSAILFEFIATFAFVRIILEITETDSKFAGIVIGLTLAVLLMIGMQITGGSLNPARSFGPAVLVGGTALKQLLLFLIVPTAGGLLAGLIHRFAGLNKKKTIWKK
jgi:aquaporin Z